MLEDDIDLESDLGSEHTPPASSCDESENDDALHHVQDARAVGEGDESDYGAAGDGDSDHADDGDGQEWRRWPCASSVGHDRQDVQAVLEACEEDCVESDGGG